MDGTAILFTHQNLLELSAKTAHGLLRYSKRYQILAVIDQHSAGQRTGELLDATVQDVPIYGSIAEFGQQSDAKADFCIIGIASGGGKIDLAWLPELESAIRHGMSLVNGMHHLLADNHALVALATQHNVALIDVRKPKPTTSLPFWTGRIQEVGCPIIPVLGSDCAVGKRSTARFVEAACLARGIKAEMIYTGQTGFLQGGRHGFIFDSTLNDFVCGELEHAILQCWEQEKPDVILVEGQAALRNPSGPCGSEMLISGRADACIFVHPAGRTHYKGWEASGRTLPPLREELALIQAYGVPTIGVALNTRAVSSEEAFRLQKIYQDELKLPVALPLESGVENLVDAIEKRIG
ncbi:MAG: DUF1611 domain-containing protein [Bacteroidia bacterium]|nr:DUF1611 domain-containing protein [Bacteroidia bacterium]